MIGSLPIARRPTYVRDARATTPRQRRRTTLRRVRVKAAVEGYAMANGAPFESPRGFYSRARDLMVNGFDLIEELSEVTIEPGDERTKPVDPTQVRRVRHPNLTLCCHS